MKKQLLSLAAFACSAVLFAQNPQIQNGGFETWPSNAKAPSNWSTIESAANEAGVGALLSGKTFSSKETAAGAYVEGVQAISIQNDEITVPVSAKIPGTLMYGKIIVNVAAQTFTPKGTPFTGSPDVIKFAYKYVPQGSDSASFFVRLTKFSALVDSSETIGGVFENLAATSTWDSVAAPIEYDSLFAGGPDSVLVGFLAGGMNNTKGSKLWVDNVRFVYNTSTGIVELPIETPTVKVYPNPVVSTLNLDIKEVTPNTIISIYGLDGKQNVSKKLEGNSISVTELAAGRYLFTISANGKAAGVGSFNVIK
ncbi:MAG: T9SS type A sorting domain-containing protein [Chitinophagales bacterium]|nr:T9SS type A sorting domain-containing protein [Chitinophagales bacterium]